ncbi:uncharacterized protein LOC134705718 [Mytilus trossulus]|uniref:uncharacterized protein LOC134705718 n=1 Tax=Mytilus trossulus TaxID=6551 RepID=UPI00300436D2
MSDVMSLKSKWMCVICEDMTFDKRWFLERHILERHSDFAWKCPECKKLFQRRNSSHGCKVLESQMICFQNSSGRRGKEAEEDFEKFRTEEMPKKIKLVDGNGNEIELAPRRNRYAKSEMGETSYRTTGTNKGVEWKKRGSSLRETSRKRTDRSDIEDNKENGNLSGPTPAKICKPSETKEQRLKKIKDVLQDLMSENGETITISVEPEADKVEGNTSSQLLEEEVELHVSETEVKTLEKANNYNKSSSSSTTSSGTSSSSSNSSRTVKKPTPDSRPQNTENVVEEPVETEIDPIRNVEFSAKTELVETFLQSLQDTQENTLTLNVGGMKIETSKNTLRADPSCVFALMLQPLSPFRPSNNVYFFDRDPAHFKIILNYLRNNCNVEKRYLPREHIYLYELLQEAKFYKLSGLVSIVQERLNDLCACRLSSF